MAVNRLHGSKLAPWAALIAGMVAYGVHHQLLSDMLRFDCRLGGSNAGLAVGIPGALLIAVGTWISWASTRGGDRERAHDQTRRFIAHVAIMLAAYSAALAVG